MNIQLKKKAAKKVRSGYPLIQAEDIQSSQSKWQTGEWVTFHDAGQHYVGTGYLGKQNKGMGWIVSRDETAPLNRAFFERLFQQAFAKRERFFADDLTTAFRIFNGEGDGLGGLTMDWYDGYILVTWYNDSLYQMKPLLLEACQAVLTNIKGVYEKNRFELSGLPESQHIIGEKAPEPLIVKENGVSFATYLDDGMMTGIFLDQKEVRGRLVNGLMAGGRVLNTFSYTGAFSVAAAMGGAIETTSVDLAKRSREKTEEMFEVNQLELATHKIVVMDIFDYIRYAKRHALTFDMVILDPPGFARNKKRTFSVQQDYDQLVADIVPLIEKKGYLIASTNVASLSYERFKEMVETGLATSHRAYRLVATHRLPEDFAVHPHFEEGNYLKVLLYELD
ncbi:class I SAM-dependent rRNA methyltransferase [Vagococcus lutrae]|uniref:class I SAM-dependent rRNA methyltransferase n=1 Tax=Vagococcus lutrae TaxID=81947 RepID=UPI00288EBFCE|nr:class I SAM-dependent rRNA methyltransferase [Vagococcus lutrae]MDT2816962.1 class I SAM-dependent rRNA methyltransferase [Vagococcus lutrae]